MLTYHCKGVLLVIACWLACTLPGVAEPVILKPVWTTIPDTAKPNWNTNPVKFSVLALMIQATDPQGNEFDKTVRVYNENHPGTSSPTFWRFTASDGKKEEVLKYRLVALKGSTGQINAVCLIPENQPQPNLVYKLAPSTGNSLEGFLNPGFEIKNKKEFLETPVDNENLDRDIAFLKGNKGVENSISVKTGDQNTAKLEMFWGFENWKEGKDWRFQAHALAEGMYRPANKDNVFSKILGEAEFLYVADLNFERDAFLSAILQIGGVARVEADQYFDNVEGSAGLSTWLAINGRGLKSLADFLCVTGDAQPFAAPMLLNLSYTCVQKLEDNIARDGQPVYDTTSRLNGKLYWSFKLARDIRLDRVWDKLDSYDLDVVINSGFAYDFRESTVFPSIEASLELSPRSLDGSKPSFVLTYMNGKTTTRFENYDAVLAGIKIPF